MNSYDEADQFTMINLLINCKSAYTQIKPILKPDYFDKKYQVAVAFLNDFSNKYSTLPTIEQLNNESRCNFSLIPLNQEDLGLRQSILDMFEGFCKKRALEIAINDCYERLQKGDTSSLDTIIKEAQSVGITKDLGINMWEGVDKYLHKLDKEMGVISTGLKELDKCFDGGLSWGQLNYVVSPSGGGKCEKRNTPIVMYDGSIKMIQDIKVGDALMGIDSKPRYVKELIHGFGEMFDVHQRFGKDFTVTRNHILSVKVKKGGKGYKLINPFDGKKYSVGEYFNISVDDYLKTSNEFKKRVACWKTSVEWDEKEIEPYIEPYFLGIWLGDGHSDHAGITTIDKEISNYIIEYSKKYNHRIRISGKDNTLALEYHIVGEKGELKEDGHVKTYPNEILKGLNNLNVINNKHIPNNYLYTSRKNRLELLAGLLDTDGYFDKKKHRFEITLKSKQLIEDIEYLCNSLGFRVHKGIKNVLFNNKELTYTRVMIYGNVKDIPTKIARKQCKEDCYYNYSESSFYITPSEENEYFGFELEESDQLYLHSDFTVTHNSIHLANFAVNWAKMGYNVVYLTLELDKELVAKRMNSMFLNMPYREISNNIDKVAYSIESFAKNNKPGVIQVADLKMGSNANDINAYLQAYEIATGIIPEIIIVDYASILSPCDKRVDKNNINLKDKAIAEELREIARERTHNGKRTMVMSANQITKDALSEMEFTLSNIAGGTTLVQTCDNLFSVRTNPAMKQQGEYEIKILKSRNSGATDKKFKVGYNKDSLLVYNIEETTESSPVEAIKNNNIGNAINTIKALANN